MTTEVSDEFKRGWAAGHRGAGRDYAEREERIRVAKDEERRKAVQEAKASVPVRVERTVKYHYDTFVTELTTETWGEIVHGHDYTNQGMYDDIKWEVSSRQIVIDKVSSRAWSPDDPKSWQTRRQTQTSLQHIVEGDSTLCGTPVDPESQWTL